MQKPAWLLDRPTFSLTPKMTAAFDRLFEESCRNALGLPIAYDLPYPKWQFLSYLGEKKGLMLHGSHKASLPEIEPQQANDTRAISAQNAIYATTDGIWAMFFAILDRARYPMGLCNTSVRIKTGPDAWTEPMYFFSISRTALEQQPWAHGAVYILPRDGFELEPSQDWGNMHIQFPHWIGKQAAAPYARLPVEANDFPFLAEIRGHDDAVLFERAKQDPYGFPWL